MPVSFYAKKCAVPGKSSRRMYAHASPRHQHCQSWFRRTNRSAAVDNTLSGLAEALWSSCEALMDAPAIHPVQVAPTMTQETNNVKIHLSVHQQAEGRVRRAAHLETKSLIAPAFLTSWLRLLAYVCTSTFTYVLETKKASHRVRFFPIACPYSQEVHRDRSTCCARST